MTLATREDGRHAPRPRTAPAAVGSDRGSGRGPVLLAAGAGRRPHRWRTAGSGAAEFVGRAVAGRPAADRRVGPGGRSGQAVPRWRHRAGDPDRHPLRRRTADPGRTQFRAAGERPDGGGGRHPSRSAHSARGIRRREGGPGAAGAEARPQRIRLVRHRDRIAHRRPGRPAGRPDGQRDGRPRVRRRHRQLVLRRQRHTAGGHRRGGGSAVDRHLPVTGAVAGAAAGDRLRRPGGSGPRGDCGRGDGHGR